MPLRAPPPVLLLRRSRHFLLPLPDPSPPPSSRRPKLHNVPWRYRDAAVACARAAVADYLHSTRSLPFHLSQIIASNSPSSLAAFISLVRFPAKPSSADVAPSIRRYLKFFPLHELDFFLESIGCLHDVNSDWKNNLVENGFFLTQSNSMLSKVVALHRAGFPWGRIGVLYTAGLMNSTEESLIKQLHAVVEFFSCQEDTQIAVAACIAFPELLGGCMEGIDNGLHSDVKQVVAHFAACVQGSDMEDFLDAFLNMRHFYTAGVAPGMTEENIRVLLKYKEAYIRLRFEFFEKLGLKREKIGPFMLANQATLDVDLEGLVISIPEYFSHVGMRQQVLDDICNKYPYVVGRNRLINLPGVLRAIELSDWFAKKMEEDEYSINYFSSEFVLADVSYNASLASEFQAVLEKISDGKVAQSIHNKLVFLRSVGFGENKLVPQMMPMIHGTEERLKARFDFFLKLGFEHSKLCKMLVGRPNLLNRSEATLQKLAAYLIDELGYSVDYLCHSSMLLTGDLENRLKPRHNMLKWLQGLGLLKKLLLSPVSLQVYTERRFVEHLYDVHPAAPKQWLEVFSSRNRRKFRLYLSQVQPSSRPPNINGRLVDSGWAHGEKLPEKSRWRCKYCEKVSSGGVTALKEHVAGIGNKVKHCEKVDDVIRVKVRDEYYWKKALKTATV